MTVRKIMVIINARAGMGRGQKCLKQIKKWRDEIAKEGRIEVVIEVTQKLGEKNATNLARKALREGYDLIISVGGDGTNNLVANGIAGTNIPVGFVQAGIANNLAKDLRIPNDIKEALGIMTRDRIKIESIDLGKVTWKSGERCFVCNFSLGLDARVVQLAETFKQKYHFLSFLPGIGEVMYGIAWLKEVFFHLEYPLVEIGMPRNKFTEGKKKEKVTLIAIVNSPTYGKILKIVPKADLRDGLLDICRIRKVGRWRILRNIFRAIKGTLGGLNEVDILPQTKSVTISSPENLLCQIDGEVLPAEKEYKISIFAKALKVIVP